MKNKIITIIYEFSFEFIVSPIIFFLLFLIWKPALISGFVSNTANDWAAKILSIILAASIAFFWTYYSHSNTEFSKWLYYKGSFHLYTRSFVVSIFIFLVTIIALIIANFNSNFYFGLVTAWLLILSFLNFFTFIKNIISLMKLNINFNIELEKAQNE